MTIFTTSFSGFPNHDLASIFQNLAQFGVPTTTLPNQFVITWFDGTSNYSLDVSGTGLTYDASGLIGGTVTSFTLQENANTLQVISGFSRTAAEFLQLVAGVAAGTSGNFATFVGTEDGEFTGSSLGDQFNFGDGDDLFNGGAGNDTFLGLGGDDTINGGDGNDIITGGDGNDTINPGDNSSFDRINGGTGNDQIIYSDVMLGFHTLDYNSLNNGINVSLDSVANTASVDKGASGTDTITDIKNPLDAGFTPIGGWSLSGTNFSDTFTVNTDSDQWMSIRGGLGADAYNVSGDGLVRLDFQGAFLGINVNLDTGVVSNDGFGNAETIIGNPWEIRGTDQTDVMVGSANDESFIGRLGSDDIDGGAGFDRIRYDRFGIEEVTVDLATGTASGMMNGQAFMHTLDNLEWVRGTRDGDDIIRGSNAVNRLQGRGGDDELKGRGGDDKLEGEDGDDFLDGGSGDDVLNGGANTEFGDFASYGGAGSAVQVYLNLGFSRGGAGDDTLIDIENLMGSNHNDRLIGDSGDNILSGRDGNDIIKSKGGNNILTGGDGDDKLTGSSGTDVMFGDDGSDILFGLAGDDVLSGGEGNDFLYGGKDTDIVSGDGGDDNIRGNLGNDDIDGGAGNDDLRGGGSNDTIVGGAGNDFLLGENGKDSLFGGLGNDSLSGGSGGGVGDGFQDTFVYSDAASGGGGFDRIKDWEDGTDLIDLLSFGYTSFSQVAATAAGGGADTRINFGNGDVLYIENFAIGDFDASDVLLT